MTSSNGMPIELVDISSRDPRLEAVVRLMHAALGDSRHSIHVTWLALRLFDELRPLHELGAEERFYLEAAGLLHDVGMMEKSGSHHKQSLHVIQNAALLPLDSRERMVIGSIARYHRKAMPSLRHDHFAALELDDQKLVSILAAMLRLADSLDTAHHGSVKDLSCAWTEKKVTITLHNPAFSPELKSASKKRADLLKKSLKRKVKLEFDT